MKIGDKAPEFKICGEKQLMEDFFRASVSIVKIPGSHNVYTLTNPTSIPYYIQCPGKNPLLLDSGSTIRISFGKGADRCGFTVLNIWIGESDHLVIDLK